MFKLNINMEIKSSNGCDVTSATCVQMKKIHAMGILRILAKFTFETFLKLILRSIVRSLLLFYES